MLFCIEDVGVPMMIACIDACVSRVRLNAARFDHLQRDFRVAEQV